MPHPFKHHFQPPIAAPRLPYAFAKNKFPNPIASPSRFCGGIPVSVASLKIEIVQCLKAGPAGWRDVQVALSAPASWLVDAARGKRQTRDIALDFRSRFSTVLEPGVDTGAFVHDAIDVLRWQIAGVRDWQEAQQPELMTLWPAAALTEVKAGKAAPGWQQRWEQCGGRTIAGRCIALKADAVWARFSEFGHAYEPFDWAAALSREDISRAETKKLGLVIPHLAPLGPQADRIAAATPPPVGRKWIVALVVLAALALVATALFAILF